MTESTSIAEEKTEIVESKAGFPNWLKTAIALVLTLGLLFYFFKDLEWQKIWQATAEANLTLAFGAILFSQVVAWLFAVYQNERTFLWFHKPFPWKEYMYVRGALFIILMINSAVGSGGSILYLQKKTQIEWVRLFSLLLFRSLLHLTAAILLMIPLTIALQFMGLFEKVLINPFLWWAGLLFCVVTFVLSWLFFHEDKSVGYVGWFFTCGEKNGNLIGGMRNRDHVIWSIFIESDKRQTILVMLWTFIPLAATALGFWLFAYAFNIYIPPILFLATIFLVLAIQDTPLTIAGFGAATLAWGLFYSDYATPEAMASLTLCLPIMRLVARGLIGLICVVPAINDVQELLEEMKTNKAPSLKDIS